MTAKVILRVISGKLTDQEFSFTERTTCLVGRSTDCQIQLPNDPEHRTVSRYHCLLDINPPAVRIRDFGSLNGTFINGENIGQRQKDQSAQDASKIRFPEYDLQNGDRIQLGKTLFRVCIDPLQPEEETLFFLPSDPLNHLEFLLTQAVKEDGTLFTLHGYKLIRELGRGGMGAVYLAEHEKTGHSVALKVMLPQVAKSQNAQHLFLREVEAMRMLEHPHIVRILDIGHVEDTFFFVSDYCEGGNANQLMNKRGGTLPLGEALMILLQILEALDYAHHIELPNFTLADGTVAHVTGLVHRDLKPSNIYLTGPESEQIAKLGDFGLAKAFDIAGLSGQTLTGAAAGTPKLIPRQQVINFKYAGPEVDVWAAAASFYYLITGTYPRDFPKEKDPWMIVLKEAPVPIRQRDPSFPRKLAEVIDTALCDNPTIPFKEANALKHAIEEAL